MTDYLLAILSLFYSEVKFAQSCLILCDPMDCTVHGIFLVRILEWVCFPSPGDLHNPGIEPRSSALLADSLPAEPQGKPKNTGVGGLFLLQQIFQTQEVNQSLLHCRWILYQLSYDIYWISIMFWILTARLGRKEVVFELHLEEKVDYWWVIKLRDVLNRQVFLSVHGNDDRVYLMEILWR